MESRETIDHASIARKGLSVIVHVAWITFSLLVLYFILYPFIEYLFTGKELVFPYYQGFMPTFRNESVTSVQYYFSLGFMHLGYAAMIVFTYYIKKMLQSSIAGRFFVHDNIKKIKMAALSLAYIVVCPLSIESALYYKEESYIEWIRVFLLGYVMPWTVIGVITFLGIMAFKDISKVYEEQRLIV